MKHNSGNNNGCMVVLLSNGITMMSQRFLTNV